MPAEILFYDGHCGLCHGAVRFLLRRDRTGAFRFAPLQGATFASLVSTGSVPALPESLVLRTVPGDLLVRSEAVAHVLGRLGGGWRWLGAGLALFPRALADSGYDLVARWRRRLFRRPPELCPMVPLEWRDRFLP